MHDYLNGTGVGFETDVYWGSPPLWMTMRGERLITAAGLMQLGQTWHRISDYLILGMGAQRVSDTILGLAFLGDEPRFQAVWEQLQREGKRVAESEGEFTTIDRTLIREELGRCEGRLQEALGDLVVLTSNSRFESRILISGASGFLGEDTAVFTNLEHSSFDDACLCLMAGAYTPSEFSSLRVVESLLLRWHAKETGKYLDDTWGHVLQALISVYPQSKDRPKELKLLDYLNERRIEVAHPKRTSRLTDAETMLLTVVGLVTDLKDNLAPASQSETDSGAE